MRNAFIISLAAHILLGFTALRLVRINSVRFVPREVYAVRLVSLEEGSPPKEEMKAPTPQAPAPKLEAKKPDELVTPEKKPKPQKKAATEKTIPSSSVEKPPAAQEGEGRQGQGTGPVTTGDVMLDVADFPFAYYISTVKRKIATNWQVPGGSSEAVHCRVYFRVARNGSIDGASVESSSGNFLFDQAALRAVVQANPLPPLPGGFPDSYLGVHFSFAYEEE